MLKYLNPDKSKWLDYGKPDSFESKDETDEKLWRIDKITGADILSFTPRLTSDEGGVVEGDRIWIYPLAGFNDMGPFFYPGFKRNIS